MRLECPCDFSIQGGHSAPLTSFHYTSWAKSSLYLGINRKDDRNSNPVFAIPKKAVTFAFREQQKLRVYELAFECLKWDGCAYKEGVMVWMQDHPLPLVGCFSPCCLNLQHHLFLNLCAALVFLIFLKPVEYVIWTASEYYISLPVINIVNSFRTHLTAGLTTWGLIHSLFRGHSQDEQPFVSHHSVSLQDHLLGREWYFCLCSQRNCSRLRQKSGRYQSWSQVYCRLPLQPWSNAFTLHPLLQICTSREVRFREQTKD